MRKYTLILLVAVLVVGCNSSKDKKAFKDDILNYVNPFIGTAGHGHTFPGATSPFGMVQLSPDTGLEGWDWCSGYHYSDNSIIGFSHTHLSGTGRSDLMDVMLMPFVGDVKLQAGTKENPDWGYRSRFSHDEEWASPGYYKVNLKDYDIMAELTVSPRCGIHRYTFPENINSHIILDLSHHFSTDSVIYTSLEVINNNTITGQRKTKGWGEPGEKYWSNQQLFFAMQVSKPFQSANVVTDDMIIEDKRAEGKNIKAILNFETKQNEKVLIKVGISAVSIENALKNLSNEIPDWNFDEVLAKTQAEWRSKLSTIAVSAPEETKNIFYTAFYHSLLAPCLYNDVNGEYLGSDKKVHTTQDFSNYTVMSLWDTFRAQNPLLTLITPDKTNDIINSMLAQYDEYGLLPVWSLWSSETNCMIGYHSIPVIVDAYFKGIRGYNVEKAYEAMKASAMQDEFGVKELKQYGYIPYDKYNKSVSTSLEYCYDDWCIAQIAKDLKRNDDYEYFMKRAATYKTYFDKEYKLMNGFSSKGKFRRPFDPFYSSYGECDWVEGNSWQYSFFVPHDVEGLIALHGDKNTFAEALDKLFSVPTDMSGHDVPIDITGLIGQYAHGNEPSHHVAYLYNYAGQPHKTQEKVHEIMTTLYTTQPDGLCGNEDCGQMSAWYVYSAMGFYPVNPAGGVYVFGKPMLDKADLKIGANTFTIEAHNLSKENIYIQSIKLNGEKYNKLYITHQDIVKGGKLEFEMGAQPSTNEFILTIPNRWDEQ
ncbi:glycoside hydrolase family 92 protein [Bacteroides sp. K03]|uniref:GH92 family glycosyl hydrolase n=1 Tax=Bacteroides sp. K03 TaxID=2718928 RepID=UPI001C8C7EC8|nr:GH92 family glycosyl hydrolase [Bacteroides sp. K03]MBX9186703.1 glycoside hydrolase family 92 protein [Bacteroides sp. K03]